MGLKYYKDKEITSLDDIQRLTNLPWVNTSLAIVFARLLIQYGAGTVKRSIMVPANIAIIIDIAP